MYKPSWLLRLLNITKPDSPTSLPVFSGWRYVPAEVRPNKEQALTVSTLWSAIRIIVEAVASSPWEIYQRVGGKRTELPDDNLTWLLNVRPNDLTTAQAFKESILFHAVFYGNGYAEIVKDVAGRIVSLQFLPSSRVTPYLHGDAVVPAGIGSPGQYVYRFNQQDGEIVWLNQDQILHFRGLSTNSQLGELMSERIIRAAALAYASEEFALEHYANGASPTGILKFDGLLKDDESRRRIQADFKERVQGSANAGKPLVLEKGWDWVQTTSLNIEQSQVLPARQFSVEELARFFGVPLHLLNVLASSQGYGTNIASVGLEFVRQTLVPWKNRIEQEINFKLIPYRAPKYVCIDLSRLTTGDDKTQADAAKVWIETGVKSINEVREEQGLDTLGPEGDLHIIGSGFKLLSADELTTPEAPSAPADVSSEPDQDEATTKEPIPSEVT